MGNLELRGLEMKLFELKDICCTLGKGETKTEALKNVNLNIEKGQSVAVVGPSGAGKSTLLNVMCGLEKFSTGKMIYDGRDITFYSEKKMAELRLKEFGFVYQAFYLISSITVRDNIFLPAVMNGVKIERSYYQGLVEKLGIDGFEKKLPYQLSGGESQRTAIARALINRPKVIFADEPTGNLDSQNGDSVFELLLECTKEFGSTLVYVTHDAEKSRLAERILYIRDGVISEEQ